MCMDREMVCYKTIPSESVPHLWKPGNIPHISNTFLPLAGVMEAGREFCSRSAFERSLRCHRTKHNQTSLPYNMIGG